MRDAYYKFVNYIQEMSGLLYLTLIFGLFAIILILIIKFFKVYNGTQKSFEKISLFVLALILFAVLLYITSIRK